MNSAPRGNTFLIRVNGRSIAFKDFMEANTFFCTSMQDTIRKKRTIELLEWNGEKFKRIDRFVQHPKTKRKG